MPMKWEEVLQPNVYLLDIVGFWPLPSNSNISMRLFAHFRILLHIISVACLLYAILYTITITWGDLSVLSEFGGIAFFYILMILKMMYVIVYRESCYRMYLEVQQLWEISHEAQERQSFENFAMMARNGTFACAIAGVGDIMMFVMPPVFTDLVYRLADNRTDMRRILPMDLSYGFDYQQSPIFELMFLWQTIGFLCSLTAVVGNDCTVMTAILHLAGQFRLINNRLQAIGDVIYYEKSRGEFVIMEIGQCIAHHQRIIGLSKDLSDLVGPMFFGQMLTSGLVICLAGFSLLKGNSSEEEIIRFTIMFICLFMQLVVWCWPGEILIEESVAIADTVFSEMPWFMLPASVQRDLSFMMLRTQKECKIISFLQVMCLRNLTEVFNTAGSYMALLRSIQA